MFHIDVNSVMVLKKVSLLYPKNQGPPYDVIQLIALLARHINQRKLYNNRMTS